MKNEIRLFPKEALLVEAWCREHRYDEGFIEVPKTIAMAAIYVEEAMTPNVSRTSKIYNEYVRKNIERDISTMLFLPDGDEKNKRGFYLELHHLKRDLMYYYDPLSRIPQNLEETNL